MREPWCATYRVGSINCDGNAWYRFKTSPTCCWITWTASSTTAAPKYASEWWKPSTATSKPYLEGAAATRISATCCSRPSAWQSPRPNSSCFRKQPKMRVSTNSCAEPKDFAGFFYNLRHVFCTRLSWVAPDAVVQHAMRHSSPETKRFYQLGLAHQVREHLERVNRKTEQERDSLQIRDSGSREEQVQQVEVCN